MDHIFDHIDEEFASKYENIFAEQHIGLGQLGGLNNELLSSVGIKKLGHRIQVLNNIKALNHQVSQQASSGQVPIPMDKSDQVFLQIPGNIAYDAASNEKSPEHGGTIPRKKKKKSSLASRSPNALDSSPNRMNGAEKMLITANARRITPEKTPARSADVDATPEPPKSKAPRFEPNLSFVSKKTPTQPGDKLNLGNKSLEMSPMAYGSVEERNQLLVQFGVLLGGESGPEEIAPAGDPLAASIDLNWATSCLSAPRLALSEFQSRSEEAISDMVRNLFSRYRPPRPHQLTAVTKLVVDLARRASAPRYSKSLSKHKNYLLQHAVGSGKTLTISALVDILHRLVVDDAQAGSRHLYELILVTCDRIDLVDQLHAVLANFLLAQEREPVILANPATAAELSNLITTCLDSTTSSPLRIITTTLQKCGQLSRFDHVIKGKRIAVVADEAHRSHGKEYSKRLHDMLTGKTKQNKHITYFSFTCTPKGNALKSFGTPSKDINHNDAPIRMRPFHVYSMKQAVKDGVVLDVLKNFSSVRIGVDFVAKCAENKIYGEGNTACLKLMKEGDSSPQVIAAKARYIVEHFDEVRSKHAKNGFVPKAMLVAPSRELVLVYRNAIEHAIDRYLPKERQFEAIAVFSPISETEEKVEKGSKKTLSETDVEVNAHNAAPFPTMLATFQSPRSRVHMVIVADKLQTGFDEPALTAMYIDKYLRGVTAVQTIGRLSRPTQGKDKIYVVDFTNDPREIVDSFSRYWGETTSIIPGSNSDDLDMDKLLDACQLLAKLPGVMMRDIDAFVEYFYHDAVTDFERSLILKKLDVIKNISNTLQIDVGTIPIGLINRIHTAIIAEGKRRLAEVDPSGVSRGADILDDVEVVVKSTTILTNEAPLNTEDLPDAARVAANRISFETRISRTYLEPDPTMSLKDILRFVEVVKRATFPQVSELGPPAAAAEGPLPSSDGLTSENFEFMKQTMEMEAFEIHSEDHSDPMEVDPGLPQIHMASSSSSDVQITKLLEVVDLTQDDSDDIIIEEESESHHRERPEPAMIPSPKRLKLNESAGGYAAPFIASENAPPIGPRDALLRLQSVSKERFPQREHVHIYRECFSVIRDAMDAAEEGSEVDAMLKESGTELVGLAAQILNMDIHEFGDILLQTVKFLLFVFTSRPDDLRSQIPYGDIFTRAALILQRPGPIQKIEIASEALRLIHLLMGRVSDDCVRLMVAQSSSAFRVSLANSFCSYESKTDYDKRIAKIALEVLYKCASLEYDILRKVDAEVPGFKSKVKMRAETMLPSKGQGDIVKKMSHLLVNPPPPLKPAVPDIKKQPPLDVTGPLGATKPSEQVPPRQQPPPAAKPDKKHPPPRKAVPMEESRPKQIAQPHEVRSRSLTPTNKATSEEPVEINPPWSFRLSESDYRKYHWKRGDHYQDTRRVYDDVEADFPRRGSHEHPRPRHDGSSSGRRLSSSADSYGGSDSRYDDNHSHRGSSKRK